MGGFLASSTLVAMWTGRRGERLGFFLAAAVMAGGGTFLAAAGILGMHEQLELSSRELPIAVGFFFWIMAIVLEFLSWLRARRLIQDAEARRTFVEKSIARVEKALQEKGEATVRVRWWSAIRVSLCVILPLCWINVGLPLPGSSPAVLIVWAAGLIAIWPLSRFLGRSHLRLTQESLAKRSPSLFSPWKEISLRDLRTFEVNVIHRYLLFLLLAHQVDLRMSDVKGMKMRLQYLLSVGRRQVHTSSTLTEGDLLFWLLRHYGKSTTDADVLAICKNV